MQFKNLFYLILALTVLVSCESDDDNPGPQEPTGAYADGAFILNEGVFGQGNSSISFLDLQAGNVTHNIFNGVNGEDLGDTATDIGFYEDMAFIVVNVSNMIQIVDRNTFEVIATIDTELNNPRKIAFLDGMAYVTNWGEGGNPDDDYVAVFNVENFDLVTRISVEEGPEDILVEGERVFVAHQGGWSFNNTISVITGNEVEKTIQVADVPNSLSAENGFLWVSSEGLPAWAGEETAGAISRIDLSTLEVTKTLRNAAASWHPSHLVVEDSRVYYTLGKEVYSFGTGEESLPSEADFTMEEVVNLYGLKLHNGRIYAASTTADFNGDGQLFIYNVTTGNLEDTHETGINPNGIYFND